MPRSIYTLKINNKTLKTGLIVEDEVVSYIRSVQEHVYKSLLGPSPFDIKNVIFNDPATIVLWADGSKTVVKATNEDFDPEKGLAMAIAKKALGNKGNYFETFKKWIPKKEVDS